MVFGTTSTTSSAASSFLQSSGVGSNIDVNSLISSLIQAESQPLYDLEGKQQTLNQQQSKYTTLQSQVSSLSTAVQTLVPDTTYGPVDNSTTNLFGKKSVAVSDSSSLIVTADSTSIPQTFSVAVQQLATPTNAKSTGSLGAAATGSALVNQIAQGSVTAGTVSVYVNGQANSISISQTDSLNTTLAKFSAISGISGASITSDGKIQLTTSPGTTLQLGANGDTSNFLTATGLATATTSTDGSGNTTLTSNLSLNIVNPNASVTGTSSGLATQVTAGSQFTIGKATFTVADGTSLNSLITQINNNSSAGVIADYNASTNKLELTSKTPGNSLITLQDASGGNFLQAMGLVTSSGNSTTSQTIGQNALLSINNGPTIQSSSNTVSSAVSGLVGVTLNLNKATTVGSPVTANVTTDTSGLQSSLNSIITNLNTVLNTINTQTDATSSSALLKNDTTLANFKNQIKTILNSALSGNGTYSTMTSIGFSTGTLSGSDASSGNTFQLDTTQLSAALAADPTGVKQLLTGSSGILTQLSTLLTQSLNTDPDPTKQGFFELHQTQTTDENTQYQTQIKRMQDQLTAKQQFYTQEFSQMNTLIAGYQSQSSAIAKIGSGFG